jgi:hypothetical protein
MSLRARFTTWLGRNLEVAVGATCELQQLVVTA